ncbi:cardiolipin synthase ClsB [Hydrogenophaga bisanensis]|uniref:Cardiolipin synthase B n=1 Tax=Hydrogenophaga bisanensis TaxID=439611 RepID=A0ABW2R980_9BURK
MTTPVPAGPLADRRRATSPRPGHQLLLLEGGDALFPALVEAMDAARSVVHLETYIFHFAGSALTVAEALERTARRGVQVRLVVDGVGTPEVPPEWQRRFAAAGVRWRVYAPLGRLGLLIPSRWRRLHRKLCVVDGTVGFCGGINIIDDRDDVALGRLEIPRLDFALRVAGPLVDDMVETMEQLWWRLQAVRKARQREFVAAWDALRETRPIGDFTRLLRKIEVYTGMGSRVNADAEDEASVLVSEGPVGVNDARAALLLRDNVSHRHDIERAYLKALGAARQDIVIANAYFIPGRRLRRALTMAAARGVRVRLLMQGRYENFFQYRAARPVYQKLIDAGIDIREYAPSALHAKVAVVDQAWATVGSTNLDPLSLLLAREANVMTTDRRFAQLLHQRLDALVEHAGQTLDAGALGSRPWHQRVLDRIAFVVMRTLLFVTGHRY